VDEVVLDSVSGARLCLHSLRAHGDVVEYVATLDVPNGSVSVAVHDDGNVLPDFLRSLAKAWRGFGGAREWASLEDQLAKP
jgi:hypothetical protein